MTSVEAQPVWVTEDAYNRMKIELAALLVHRATGEVVDESLYALDEKIPDAGAAMMGWEQRERRIRQLQVLVQSAIVHEPPDDGIAEPGMIVTVRYRGMDSPTQTFLIADRRAAHDGELEICSPHSPLGRALLGAAPGEEREFEVPSGGKMMVTLVRAVPFRGSSDGSQAGSETPPAPEQPQRAT